MKDVWTNRSMLLTVKLCFASYPLKEQIVDEHIIGSDLQQAKCQPVYENVSSSFKSRNLASWHL